MFIVSEKTFFFKHGEKHSNQNGAFSEGQQEITGTPGKSPKV